MPHPTPPHHQRSIKNLSKFTQTLTCPTPPHHQRSIKNLRLEKEAFRDLSFRSVGINMTNIYQHMTGGSIGGAVLTQPRIVQHPEVVVEPLDETYRDRITVKWVN